MSNLSPKYTPTTYADAKRILDLKGKSAITLCYATSLVRFHADAYAIIHHNTAIVIWRSNGDISLSGDGWASRTTADRMHRFTPPNVQVNSRQGRLNVVVDGMLDPDNAAYGLTIRPL